MFNAEGLHTLITAASSAKAYQLKSKLNLPGILLGDYMELPDTMLKSGKMILLPDPKISSYTHEVLRLCLDHHITTIYALREQEQQLLREAMQLFKEYNISIVIIDDEI